MMNDHILIRDSFELIGEMPEAVAMLFYGRLFDVDPSLRGLFKTDMRSQAKKLVETVAVVVDALERLDSMTEVLADLGKRHEGYGVKAEHYGVVRDALLWSFGQALQSDFDAETRSAWKSLLDTVATGMLAGTTGKATSAHATSS